MNKTWGEIRKEAVSLGFDKETAFIKNKDSFAAAYNWAVNHIAAITGCIVDRVEIQVSESDRPQFFDLHSVADGFLSLAAVGIVDENMHPVEWAYVAENSLLVIPAGCGGKITVYYSRAPQPITAAAADSTLCPLPYKWAMLVPYYMANRLFLDDDGAKAGYYWNLAEDMKADMLKKERQRQINILLPQTEGRWC